MKSKIIAKKNVFKAKLFTVEEIKLQLPDKKEKIHHLARRNPTVTVFPLTDSYDLYLVSQYRYMLEKKTLEAMAGFIDSGETSLQAAKRELIEETGIVAHQWEELSRIELAGSVFRAQAHLFLAKDLTFGKPQPEEDEEIELIKMPLQVAVAKVITGEINHSASMIGILMLDKLRKEKKL